MSRIMKNNLWLNKWFLLHNIDGHVMVYHLLGKQWLDTCTTGHKQGGGSDIMVWGTFSWASRKPLVVIEYIMKGANYLNIFVGQLHLYMVSVFHTANSLHVARLKLCCCGSMIMWMHSDWCPDCLTSRILIP